MGRVALEALSPTRCAGCERAGELVCDRCLGELALIDPTLSCARCGAPFGRMLCTECRGAAAQVDRCLAAAVFEGPLPRIVRAYKDAGERRLARPIAEMLHDAASHAEAVAPDRFGGLLSESDAIVFVPATGRAYRRRGFDHMELVSRQLALLSGVPCLDALIKHGSGDQRLLGREERLDASRGVYEVATDVGDMRLLLVDDVITTGATISACAAALGDAGAARVDALTLARVW
ncbi:MAG: phosphoribosyltransferase family protein [Collinsella sp.]|nr:phosphoribosyltransferase family protein [Collinsella sp.]